MCGYERRRVFLVDVIESGSGSFASDRISLHLLTVEPAPTTTAFIVKNGRRQKLLR